MIRIRRVSAVLAASMFLALTSFAKTIAFSGASIPAKATMSEFASGGPYSSVAGQSLNPHDVGRGPSGPSGGTGGGIAAACAPLGMGTDTGGSIRGPATSNGIAALKPTHGLL